MPADRCTPRGRENWAAGQGSGQNGEIGKGKGGGDRLLQLMLYKGNPKLNIHLTEQLRNSWKWEWVIGSGNASFVTGQV